MTHVPPEFDEAMLPSDAPTSPDQPNESGFPTALKKAALGLMMGEDDGDDD